jgi:hypothetical protein
VLAGLTLGPEEPRYRFGNGFVWRVRFNVGRNGFESQLSGMMEGSVCYAAALCLREASQPTGQR